MVLNNLTFTKGPDEPADNLYEIINEILAEIGKASVKMMKLKISNMYLRNDAFVKSLC